MTEATGATQRECVAVVAHGASDVGCERDGNEDAWLIGDLDAGAALAPETSLDASMVLGPVLIVCDGMGGVHGGEVASALAVAAVWREVVASKSEGSADEAEILGRRLRRAIRIAHGEVLQRGKQVKLRGMGTTLCVAAIAGDQLVLGTVGDSRAYLLRAGNLVQVTRDQSVQSVMRARGRDAGTGSNAILQAIGVGADVEPSLSFVPLCTGDRILLCTDGLYRPVEASVIATILAEPGPPDEIAQRFVAAARAAGGADNITAVIADVAGPRLAAPTDEIPMFREFDPHRQGDDALTDTSHVVRRLAAQVGLSARRDGHREIPVTGQHRAFTDLLPASPRTSRPRPPVPGGGPTLRVGFPVRLVVDHVAGARRGERQELGLDTCLRFGRHPDCEVAFDVHRDLDASARHAELRRTGERWLLIDLGSANGTFVDRHRATETPLVEHVAYVVQFGPGGPTIQIMIAGDDEVVAVPGAGSGRPVALALGAGVLVLAAAIAAWWVC